MKRISIKMNTKYRLPVIQTIDNLDTLIDTGANIPVAYLTEDNLRRLNAVPIKELNNISVLGIDGYADGKVYKFESFSLNDFNNPNDNLIFEQPEFFVPNQLPIGTKIIKDSNGNEKEVEYLKVHPLALPGTMFYGTHYHFDTIMDVFNNSKGLFHIDIPANFQLIRHFEISIDNEGKPHPVVNRVIINDDMMIQQSFLEENNYFNTNGALEEESNYDNIEDDWFDPADD